MAQASHKKSVCLLSYPRSGNTWLRYCIEVLTKRPTMREGYVEFHSEIGGRPLYLNMDINVDKSLPPVYKAHYILQAKNMPLILLLRNPKECMLSHGANIKDPSCIKKIIDKLRFFESVMKPKLLVSYEDLMLEPRKELLKVMQFLVREPDLDLLDAFMEKYEEHSMRLADFYSTHIKPVITADKTLLNYHSKSLPKEELIEFDSALEVAYPKLWNKYLKRYSESF